MNTSQYPWLLLADTEAPRGRNPRKSALTTGQEKQPLAPPRGVCLTHGSPQTLRGWDGS